MREEHPDLGQCEGIGLVVPGMVDRGGDRICSRRGSAGATSRSGALAAATGLPVHIENSGRACALAQVLGRAARRRARTTSCSSPSPTASAWASSSTARCCAAGTTSRASSATCRSTSTGRRARAAPPGAGRPTCRTSPRCRGTSAASSRRASRSRPRSRRSRWTT